MFDSSNSERGGGGGGGAFSGALIVTVSLCSSGTGERLDSMCMHLLDADCVVLLVATDLFVYPLC